MYIYYYYYYYFLFIFNLYLFFKCHNYSERNIGNFLS